LEAWASAGDAMLGRHSGMDMSEEEFQAAARGLPADSPFLNVQSGSSSVPATPQQGPWSGPAFNRARDRQEDVSDATNFAVDLILGAGGTVGDIAAGVVDMLDPDPNALARDPSNPFHNALENLTDVGLRVP